MFRYVSNCSSVFLRQGKGALLQLATQHRNQGLWDLWEHCAPEVSTWCRSKLWQRGWGRGTTSLSMRDMRVLLVSVETKDDILDSHLYHYSMTSLRSIGSQNGKASAHKSWASVKGYAGFNITDVAHGAPDCESLCASRQQWADGCESVSRKQEQCEESARKSPNSLATGAEALSPLISIVVLLCVWLHCFVWFQSTNSYIVHRFRYWLRGEVSTQPRIIQLFGEDCSSTMYAGVIKKDVLFQSNM